MDLQLTKYRKRHHLTQVELARQVGVSFQSISKWETGAALPDITMLVTIADLFSITVDDLIGRNHMVYGLSQTTVLWDEKVDYLHQYSLFRQEVSSRCPAW